MAALGVTNFFKLPVSVPYAMLAPVLCSSLDPNPWHRELYCSGILCNTCE